MKEERVENFLTGFKRISEGMKPTLEILSDLMGRENKLQEVIEIFDNDVEYLMAVQFQNMFHPQNKHRTQAIKDGNYVFIDSGIKAKIFLSD